MPQEFSLEEIAPKNPQKEYSLEEIQGGNNDDWMSHLEPNKPFSPMGTVQAMRDQAPTALGIMGSVAAPMVGMNPIVGAGYGGAIGGFIKDPKNALGAFKSGVTSATEEGVGRGIGKGIGMIGNALSSKLYRNALKSTPEVAESGINMQDPNAGWLKRGAARMLGIEPKGIPVSEEGLGTVTGKFDAAQLANQKASSDAANKGATVSAYNATRPVVKLSKEYSKASDLGQESDQARGVAERFLDKNKTGKKLTPIPTDKAYETVKTDRAMSRRVESPTSSNPKQAAREELTKGLEQELIKKVPEMAKLLPEEWEASGLKEAMESVLARPEHEISHTGAHALMHPTGTYTSVLAARQALSNPELKSKIAIALRMIKDRHLSTKGISLGTGLQAVVGHPEN